MIVLPRSLFDDIVDHAVAGIPAEVCGVLGGDFDAELSRATISRRAINVAPAPEHEYAIDPTEQFELMEAIEDDGDDIVGFYHSHPTGPPGPSETDATQATWPKRSYFIVTLGGRHPFAGSWRWNPDTEGFEQEIVRLVP